MFLKGKYILLTAFVCLQMQNQFPVSGTQTARVQLIIKDDNIPEPSEKIFVFLSSPTGGARLAIAADNLQVTRALFTWDSNREFDQRMCTLRSLPILIL